MRQLPVLHTGLNILQLKRKNLAVSVMSTIPPSGVGKDWPRHHDEDHDPYSTPEVYYGENNLSAIGGRPRTLSAVSLLLFLLPYLPIACLPRGMSVFELGKVPASSFLPETIHVFLFIVSSTLGMSLYNFPPFSAPLGMVVDTCRADRSMSRLIFSGRRLFICFRNWADIGECSLK